MNFVIHYRQGTWQATVHILLGNLAWAASHFLNHMAHSDSLLRADHDEWLRFTARETEQKISRSRCLPSPTTSPLSLLPVKWWCLFTISSQAYADFKSLKNWVTEAVFWPTSCIHSSQTHVLEYKGLVIHFSSSASLIRDTHCSRHALSDIMEISRLRALDSDAAGKKKKRLSGSLIYCSWRDWEGKKSKTGLFVLSLTPDYGLRQPSHPCGHC